MSSSFGAVYGLSTPRLVQAQVAEFPPVIQCGEQQRFDLPLTLGLDIDEAFAVGEVATRGKTNVDAGRLYGSGGGD
jgi:hypothetical protein